LNDEIDEHFHDNLLSLADRCGCGRVLGSSANSDTRIWATWSSSRNALTRRWIV
jgi:hypothetical protein